MHSGTIAPPMCQPARPSISRPRKKAPPNACDCHIHIIGPHSRFPLGSNRAYTPPEASIAQYEAVQDILGTERVVVVQASVYGTDNRCTLAALDHFGPSRSRGVVVIAPSIGDVELRMMHDAGVRGIRINLVTPGGPPIAHLTALARRIAPFGWHTQVFVNGASLPELAPTLRSLPTDVVIDHLGHIPCAWGFEHPAFDALRGLLDGGRVWLKACAYRSSVAGYPFDDVDDIAARLVAHAPQRCVWGTDWPHPSFEGTLPDDGELLDAFMRWAPDPAVQQMVLVDNPAHLYQFT
ncbi:Predicted metal-dependent hydrolase, TIM-barrel fold [Paraburkholderia lycopersici]|uniref:Predicted metal-dependent hydrolase, TIM-barrel fold n=2 Tax=Paraburkholderia lycopersici TaxID=416944 RepID=A0A1G6TQD3_9BURK|nr:Predicted metal-dependent hydrolase, TIM-barrel fold [Paraburkholderia lycopersici]